MDQFFASLPKTVLALGAIIVGFLLIVLNDPPHTVCDTQLEIFKESQKIFLFERSNKGIKTPPEIKEKFAICQRENSPGGCFELFEKLKKLHVDLRNIPAECSEAVGSLGEVRKWLFSSLELMAQIAWGSKAPSSYTQRHSWYDASDVALFCDLKAQAVKIYGNATFEKFRESVIQTFPGASGMARDQVWQRTIFATQCDNYR